MVKLNRPRIGFFGKMNVGKSSLVNALTGQQVSVVAQTPGTTTDPVKKIMELVHQYRNPPGYPDRAKFFF